MEKTKLDESLDDVDLAAVYAMPVVRGFPRLPRPPPV